MRVPGRHDGEDPRRVAGGGWRTEISVRPSAQLPSRVRRIQRRRRHQTGRRRPAGLPHHARHRCDGTQERPGDLRECYPPGRSGHDVEHARHRTPGTR